MAHALSMRGAMKIEGASQPVAGSPCVNDLIRLADVLLALGAEFPALLSMQSLGIGLLRTFEGSRGAFGLLLGRCRLGRRGFGWLRLGRWRRRNGGRCGLREGGAGKHQ